MKLELFKHIQLTPTKGIEFQSMPMWQLGLGLIIRINRGDHWGWCIELYLPGYWAMIQLYDYRHDEEGD